MQPQFIPWADQVPVQTRRYTCSYCENVVGPDRGYTATNGIDILICSFCNQPTFFCARGQFPGAPFGRSVEHLPQDIEATYREARDCMKVNAYTASVLTCRKLLMHIAVETGAAENLRFQQYVDHLDVAGFIPPNGKQWVDHIRKKGNEATHEIVVMSREQAESILIFLEMLLKFVYEFPSSIPPP